MAASRLNDGMPITTEWLNSLVDEINRLKSGSSVTSIPGPRPGGPGTKVPYIAGRVFNAATSSNMKIVADRVTGTAGAGELTFEASVVFESAFSDNNVIVVATPSFVSTTDRIGKPAKASASVGQISSTGFLLTVSFVEDSNTYTAGKQVTVDYIAIGNSL